MDRVMGLVNDAMVSINHLNVDLGMNTTNYGAGIRLPSDASNVKTYTFALPLKKTLFDTLKHAFPLGKCRSNLRVDITFNQFSSALTSAGAIGGATIKNLNLVYEELQLP